MENIHENGIMEAAKERERVIVRTSLVGIAANVLLSGAKAAIGLLANSIAVVLDAVNNLTDAISSIVTLIGTKLANRKPDKRHPLGHGRIEFLAAMIVAALVLYAGVTAAIESVKKIITPEAPDYTPVSLVVIGIALAVKLALGLFFKSRGKKANSAALTASGSDALFDAVISASVLVSAVIYLTVGANLEAYVGAIISLFIIKAGVGMMRETLNEILGRRVERALLTEIRHTICEDPEVNGAFDLILHNYGPDKYVGSVHVEIDDTMTADQIDAMERRIADRVYREHGVLLAGIGIYSANTKSDAVRAMRSEVTRLVMSHDDVLQIHGFFVDEEAKTCSFDVIIDYSCADRDALYAHICADAQAAYPDFKFTVIMDIDF